MTDSPGAPPLVVGIGALLRGDDGVGPLVADLVQKRLPSADAAEVRVLDGEPARLLDAWTGRDVVVVIDAIHRADPPGTVHRVVVDAAFTARANETPSTHGGGLAEAIELGRVLDRLPRHLVVYGIEPADLSVGAGLSDEVRAGVPDVVDAVLTEVGG